MFPLFLPKFEHVRHDMIGIINAEQFKFDGKVADLPDSRSQIQRNVVWMLVLIINLVALI